MKKVLFVQVDNENGLVKTQDHDCLLICRKDGVAELHDAKALIGAVHTLVPLGGVTISVRCHGEDTFDNGSKEIQISEQKPHVFLSSRDGDNKPVWCPLFTIPPQPTPQPVAAEPVEPEPIDE